MRRLIITILLTLYLSTPVFAGGREQIERFANSLPVFFAFTGLQAAGGTLTVGVFSETTVGQDVLDTFKNLKPWANESVVSQTKHTKIEVVALSAKNIDGFKGQIIWVLDIKDSQALLKAQTEKGIYTIGAQEETYQSDLFTTLLYDNVSDDPKVEKWRLTKLIANCELSKLRYSDKLTSKEYFLGKACGN